MVGARPDSNSARKTVFLSSVFRDQFGDDFRDVPLRRRILDDKAKLPVRLWAYEHYWPKGSEEPSPDADTIIDRCFGGVKSADLFAFLLTGRHGSGVTYFSDPAWVSYLELELFAASVLRKPIIVFHLRGHEPEPALRDTMILLSKAFATGEYLIDDESGLYRRFRQVCKLLAAGKLTFNQRALLAHLPEWLSVQRTRASLRQDLLDPRLMFLDGRLKSGKTEVNPDRAARLIAQVSSGTRSTADGEKPMPHGAALFRLWAAMRELMDEKGTTLSDPSAATLWDRTLGLWAGKASWFGLHGHLWMGPLAAINSQIGLRARFASSSAYSNAQDVREPLGARASAIYSIAQRIDTRRRKFFHYRQVVRLATQAAGLDKGAKQGVLSVRAHALMQMAQLGHVWKLWDALPDFKRSLELRVKSNAPPASIGEAMCDLGFCTVLTGRHRAGLALIQDGVKLLRSDPSPNGLAFLARGLRKLERAGMLCGAAAVSKQAREERLAIAAQVEALDQAREP